MNEAEGRILTMTDKRNLEKELEELRQQKLQVAEEIKIARGHGDLSENAEYDEAKNAEARVYGRLMEVENTLKTAIFVDDSKLSTDVVAVGTVVKVYDMDMEEEETYTLVGFTESDPAKLFISGESPIGKALLGARVGDVVEAQTPGGAIQMKILEIRHR
ncbi:MAG TPA: transcription elongation factor GreA [Candidatus Pullichristensenella excrementigallinarum]|uniref:Transcription elongation factor GreA n=1 Tax=Candidatus Pullichristensenella excrementigallinarum TaxID=2840907 RepID=A0A9D1IDZ6_9FIRM|nr:transcription elongation factor GreA [Candidatus Pullichristensenella excrementigallinarum]